MKKTSLEKLSLGKFRDNKIKENLLGGIGGPATDYDEFYKKVVRTAVNIGSGNGEPFQNDVHYDYNEDGVINGNDSYYEETHPGTGN
ncbi:hypothetical protein EZY14_012865 [Kordia sp. TARA_039_SRF]|nr:hypothetical protein EZY14_012865 [Kordia sp. TARA_039_SRF]